MLIQPAMAADLGEIRNHPIDILYFDAIQCGLSPDTQDVWGFFGKIISPLDKRARFWIIVGERANNGKQNTPAYKQGYKYGVDIAGNRIIIHPWHLAMKLENNPLEIQWRWQPGAQPEIAILNIEHASSQGQITEIFKERKVLTRNLHKLSPGPDPPQEQELIEIVEKWKDMKSQGYTQSEFCGFMGWDSRTPLTKALRWYRDRFGRDSI